MVESKKPYSNRFFVVKDRKDLSITYFEYDKVKGYDLMPKNVKIKDAIDVNKMIIINPSMIQKLAYKKVNSKFMDVVKLLMFVLSSDNDDTSGDTYRHALNEITKLRLEILMKYKNKLKEDDFNVFNNKLDLLEQELKVRMFYLQNFYVNNFYNNYNNSFGSRYSDDYESYFDNNYDNEMEREGKSR